MNIKVVNKLNILNLFYQSRNEENVKQYVDQ